MKFFNLCLVLFLFTISCSNTEELPFAANESSSSIPPSFDTMKLEILYPSNAQNPYDIVGSMHVELYKAYYNVDGDTLSALHVAEQVLLLANENEKFAALGNGPLTLTSESVTYLNDQLGCCSTALIRDSLLTSEASTLMQNFMTDIVPYSILEDDFALIYEMIVSYETIVNESQIPLSDKQVLLSTSAVVRYVTFERKKRPKKNTDPDWDLMVWRIAGSSFGSIDGLQNSVVCSVIGGVLEDGE